MVQRRTRIKICGIRDLETALASIEAGADAVGLVFHPASPRQVSDPVAAAIAARLPAFTDAVALFVDAEAARVREVIDAVRPGWLQFHGEEEDDFCAQFRVPFVKAVPVDGESNLLESASRFPSARALLLDSAAPGSFGGSGVVFDWRTVPGEMASRIVLAGGLTPDNVAAAIRTVRPWAVDVSSGVERERGVKDVDLIRRFISEVRNADV